MIPVVELRHAGRWVCQTVAWGVCEGSRHPCGLLGVLFKSPSGDVRVSWDESPWLCLECDRDHQEDWHERWAEYYSGQGFPCGEFEPPEQPRALLRAWEVEGGR